MTLNDKREQIQAEALATALEQFRCSLALSMRTGKTKIGLDRLNIEYQRKKDLKILVVAPKLSVFTSWKDDAVKFNLEHLIDKIKFTTYLSLKKQDLDYDIVIFDEVHSLKNSHRDWLNKYKGKILGLTGTAPKYSTSEKFKMLESYCPVVYKYITKDAVDDHVLNDYRIMVHMIELSSENNLAVKTKSGGVFYTTEVNTYNFWSRKIEEAGSAKQRQMASIMRMKSMQGFPSKVKYAKRLLSTIEEKVIVFTNTQEQADELSSHSYHSKNPLSKENLQAFKEGHISQLSCVLQLDEGITIPDLSQGIVTHGYSGSSPKTKQRFGRLLGLNPDETCIFHILCYKGTAEERWIEESLEDLDQEKIRYVEFKKEAV